MVPYQHGTIPYHITPTYHLSSTVMSGDYYRPRYLYFSFFVWISTTGGRFLAPFLEHQGRLPAATIGVVLGLQSIVSMVLSSWGGSWADERERRRPGQGRVQVMACGIIGGAICCLLHAVSYISSAPVFASPWWHGGLQLVYAACFILTIPILDGVTIQFLEDHPEFTQASYGVERLWGAIGWAVIHMIMAPLLDWIGFVVIYPLAFFSTLGALGTLYQYVTLNKPRTTYKRRTSDVMVTTESDSPPEIAPPKLPLHMICRLFVGNSYGIAFLFALLTLSQGQAGTML